MSGHLNHSTRAKTIEVEPAQADFTIVTPYKSWRRALYFFLVGVSTFAGVATMARIMAADGISVLEISLLILFAMTFSWICVSFWNAIIGFIIDIFNRDPLSLKRYHEPDISSRQARTRTAIVMPIYNEDTERVMAGFRAIIEEVQKTPCLEAFDFYLLSDTQEPLIAAAEQKAWQALQEALPPILKVRIFYRRRAKNIDRKVGNLRDFCERWGSYYDFMLVLDADSIMTADSILRLVFSMEDNDRAGLIQTVPIPVRQTTFFGRFLQFAAVLHSPMLAKGLAFWQTDSANYWGHNAIVRIEPFIDCCGLPKIEGKGPLNGEILSHDFVEAALIRREGWDVYLLANLTGSYEEIPSNLIDYATRDRRWVQGNLQHLALLTGARLTSISRLHFFFGATAYITTLLWLLMLTLSTADAIWSAIHPHSFFSASYQLFPDWPIDNSLMIYSMLYITASFLLLPKLMATICALKSRAREFGGVISLVKGSFIEIVFSILVAPLMMFFHSYFVLSVLFGHKVSWDAQTRDSRVIPWRESFKRTLFISVLAVIWAGVTYSIAPLFFAWLVPVLSGLILAAPIVRYSSSEFLGSLFKRAKIFSCPYEINPKPVIQYIAEAIPLNNVSNKNEKIQLRFLPERYRAMPVRSFSDAA